MCGSKNRLFSSLEGMLLQGEGEALDIAAVGADHDLEVTGLADIVEVFVVELEQVGIDLERNGAALAGLEGDAVKALQLNTR